MLACQKSVKGAKDHAQFTDVGKAALLECLVQDFRVTALRNEHFAPFFGVLESHRQFIVDNLEEHNEEQVACRDCHHGEHIFSFLRVDDPLDEVLKLLLDQVV